MGIHALFLAGTARYAVRAPTSMSGRNAPPLPATSFRPLDAGGDIAARCPYQQDEQRVDAPVGGRRGGVVRRWRAGCFWGC